MQFLLFPQCFQKLYPNCSLYLEKGYSMILTCFFHTQGELIWIKFHSKHPLNVLAKIPSNCLVHAEFWFPWQPKDIFVVGRFQKIMYKKSLGDPLSNSFMPC